MTEREGEALVWRAAQRSSQTGSPSKEGSADNSDDEHEDSETVAIAEYRRNGAVNTSFSGAQCASNWQTITKSENIQMHSLPQRIQLLFVVLTNHFFE